MFGLRLLEAKKIEIKIPSDIQELLDERKLAKENKDWIKADEIRKNIENKGFSIKDLKGGLQELTKI